MAPQAAAMPIFAQGSRSGPAQERNVDTVLHAHETMFALPASAFASFRQSITDFPVQMTERSAVRLSTLPLVPQRTVYFTVSGMSGRQPCKLEVLQPSPLGRTTRPPALAAALAMAVERSWTVQARSPCSSRGWYPRFPPAVSPGIPDRREPRWEHSRRRSGP